MRTATHYRCPGRAVFINAAQYNTLDLNDDAKMDLVLFDRMANKVITYINVNNQYQYAPEYESLFPDDVTNWILLRDYNCDGKKDLFTGDILGMKVYTNVTPPGGTLSWQKYFFYVSATEPKSPVLLTKGFTSLINLQLQYDDLPSISDVDGDGDLDIMCMRFVGNGTAEYHQNFSKERYGSCDSLVFERETQMWGKFTECLCGQFAFDSAACPSPTGGRVQHAGGKSILAIDIDGDNDLDLLFSEATCTQIYLLRNQGTTANPVIHSHESFPASFPINFYIYPAVYYEDIDFDGIKELIATPNIYAKTYFNSDLSASNWLYKNTGTPQAPTFTFVKPNLLQENMIDIGDNSIAAFADYDGDGDQDMFISEDYTYALGSAISLYENTGTADLPAFKLKTNNYINFSAFNFYNTKIQFADMNGDNKIDLIFTATDLLAGLTKLYYIPNNNGSAFDFSDQFPVDVNFQIVSSENVYVNDVNFDGKPDLLVGRSTGAMEYWQNSGSLNFILQNAGFLGLTTSVIRQNPSCVIADLNADGKTDFIYSDQTGSLKIISDFRNATDLSGEISDIVFNPINKGYEAHNLGGRVWPTVTNLFNKDKPAIVVGNILGGVQLLRNDNGEFLPEEPSIEVYPIPVLQSETLQIKVDRLASVQMFSALGQSLGEPVLLQGNQLYAFKMSTLASGVYILRFGFNKKSYSKRIVVY